MGAQREPATPASARTPSRKRKLPTPPRYVKESRRKKVDTGEKRLRRSGFFVYVNLCSRTSELTAFASRFRARPPQNFSVIYERATSQRFYVLGRTRGGAAHCPEESVELTGSTGNIYVVHIARQPTCTCPHAQNGNQCKHVIYVMSRVLRARFDLVYQLALLTTELQEIFNNAPPIETGDDSDAPGHDKNRKSLEGDCPICFMPFEAAEATVYCRATCGQNSHKECFEMWAATKRKSAGDQVTCPMCRTPWQGDDDMVKKIQNNGIIGSDGYVNVADQLGISGERDHSTYYYGPRRGARSGGWW
ncbi:hypothetical protein F5Y13DRAFT_194894 [Hypoxylon sp. FL1857]|nr:hypothetical protein F5Y13DRAFT_194894 [Hypoxylon sp. FL1857]